MRLGPTRRPTSRSGCGRSASAAWLEGGEADPAARKDPLFAAAPRPRLGGGGGSRPAQAEILQLIEAAGIDVASRPDLPPLYAAARAVADDLCLMEKRDGELAADRAQPLAPAPSSRPPR